MGKVTHGMFGTPIYKVWGTMVQRCTNPNAPHWERYGGRGIKCCARWLVFANFYEDMGPRPSDKHSIDRIDNDGHYEPSNCRWATKSEQNQNSGKKTGMTSRYVGVSWSALRSKWKACIRINGKQLHLGYFDAELEARAARRTAELARREAAK